MPILINNQIRERVLEELELCEDSLQLVSAFCKESVVKFLDDNCKIDVPQKRLLVRFQKGDLISNTSDLSLYDYCIEHNWDLYINFSLHAKIFIFDSLRYVIGSSNLTGKGFLFDEGNYEAATFDYLDDDDCQRINNLFASSTLMTPELYEKMKQEMNSVESNKKVEGTGWSDEIKELVKDELSVLFAEDFPTTEDVRSLNHQPISFLNLQANQSLDDIKRAFINSKCFSWLKKVLKENNSEMYFGAITASLHDALINEPKPYRRDVKILLQNLLSWINCLDIDEVKIDRPGYSQRVRLM